MNVDDDQMTDEELMATARQLGIINILAETALQTTLFSVKTTLLILYHRLT